jgi:hypothetical protein
MCPKSYRKEIIYKPLLNEGFPVYRPTYGLQVGEHTFVVLLPSDYTPESEEWKFPPGNIVVCKKKVLTGTEGGVLNKNECLVARSRIDPGELKDFLDSGPSDIQFS